MKRIAIAAAAGMVLALALPAAAAPDGKALYSSKCAMCHGQDGVAKKMGEPAKAFGSAEFKKEASADMIMKTVKEGKEKMKAIKTVGDEDLKAIADYILAMPAK
jgi:mono/diheme cytochrome c family protein